MLCFCSTFGLIWYNKSYQNLDFGCLFRNTSAMSSISWILFKAKRKSMRQKAAKPLGKGRMAYTFWIAGSSPWKNSLYEQQSDFFRAWLGECLTVFPAMNQNMDAMELKDAKKSKDVYINNWPADQTSSRCQRACKLIWYWGIFCQFSRMFIFSESSQRAM